jgi:hypothetical protein
MKQTLQKKSRCMLFLVYISIASFQSLGQTACETQRVDFANEPKLNLTDYIIDLPRVNHHAGLFRTRFKAGENLSPFDTLPETISMHNIVELYCKAKASAEADESCTGKQCVTGVKITFGLEANKIIYFYQPVYLRLKEVKAGRSSYKVVNNIRRYFYRHRGNAFTHEPDTTPFNTYREKVRIKRFKNRGSYAPMRQYDGDWRWKGDSKSIKFTFQEIFMLYDLAFTETDNDRYNENITINNGAADYKKWGINFHQTKRAKHTLFIATLPSPDPSRNKKNKLLFTDKRKNDDDGDGANFAHLCPPSCNEVIFDN